MNKKRGIDIEERLNKIKSLKDRLDLAIAHLDSAYEIVDDTEEIFLSILEQKKILPSKNRHLKLIKNI